MIGSLDTSDHMLVTFIIAIITYFIILYHQFLFCNILFFNIYFFIDFSPKNLIFYNGYKDLDLNTKKTTPILFSIMICIFNKLHYLNHSFSSLFCQNYSNFEIVAVDDCSIDGSFYFLKNISFPYFILIRHSKNMGLLYSRKSAINAARGKYLITLDPDDRLACNLLWTISHILQNDDYDIIEYSFYFVENGRNRKSPHLQPGIYNKSSLFRLKWIHWSYWSRCYKRKILKQGFSLIPENLFKIRLTRTEDLIAFFTSLLFCENYKIIDFYGYFYFPNLKDSSKICSNFTCKKNKNDEKLGKDFVKKLWESKNLTFRSF